MGEGSEEGLRAAGGTGGGAGPAWAPYVAGFSRGGALGPHSPAGVDRPGAAAPAPSPVPRAGSGSGLRGAPGAAPWEPPEASPRSMDFPLTSRTQLDSPGRVGLARLGGVSVPGALRILGWRELRPRAQAWSSLAGRWEAWLVVLSRGRLAVRLLFCGVSGRE